VCARGGARGAPERGAHARTRAKTANLRLGRRVEVVVRVDEPSAVDVPIPGGVDAAPVFVAQSAGPVGRETCHGPSGHRGSPGQREHGGLGCGAGAGVPGVPGAHLRSNSGLCSLRSRVSRDDTQQFEMEHMRSMSWFIVCCPALLFAQYSLKQPTKLPPFRPSRHNGHQGPARGPGAEPAAVRQRVPTPHRATPARPAPAVAADAAAVAAASKAHDCDCSLPMQARPRKGVQRESVGH
jgi:hypothetical protein